MRERAPSRNFRAWQSCTTSVACRRYLLSIFGPLLYPGRRMVRHTKQRRMATAVAKQTARKSLKTIK